MTIQAQLAASQTALICVRMALMLSQTPEEFSACMAAFAIQLQRVNTLQEVL